MVVRNQANDFMGQIFRWSDKINRTIFGHSVERHIRKLRLLGDLRVRPVHKKKGRPGARGAATGPSASERGHQRSTRYFYLKQLFTSLIDIKGAAPPNIRFLVIRALAHKKSF